MAKSQPRRTSGTEAPEHHDATMREARTPPPGLSGVGVTALIAKSYDRYFSSGLYHSRYPRPNRRTLRLIERLVPHGGRLLDYGAGEGRYGLAVAQSRAAKVVAVDISETARHALAAQIDRAELSDQVKICSPGDAVYQEEVVLAGNFDVVLFAFGVLGHIAGRERRVALLRGLLPSLAPDGRLVLGLPNKRRRFRNEQAAMVQSSRPPDFEEGDLYYHRYSEEGSVELFYHLFDRQEVIRDLTDAGYEIEHLTGESLLPETAVTRYKSLGCLDDACSSVLPSDWSYGFLVSAKIAGA